VVTATAGTSSLHGGGGSSAGGGAFFCSGSGGVATGARGERGKAVLVEASCVVDSPLLAVDLRSAGGEGLIPARVLGDVVGMAEAASRKNKGAGARSPSRQGHLWRRR
jgi:hypothetical protein